MGIKFRRRTARAQDKGSPGRRNMDTASPTPANQDMEHRKVSLWHHRRDHRGADNSSQQISHQENFSAPLLVPPMNTDGYPRSTHPIDVQTLRNTAPLPLERRSDTRLTTVPSHWRGDSQQYNDPNKVESPLEPSVSSNQEMEHGGDPVQPRPNPSMIIRDIPDHWKTDPHQKKEEVILDDEESHGPGPREQSPVTPQRHRIHALTPTTATHEQQVRGNRDDCPIPTPQRSTNLVDNVADVPQFRRQNPDIVHSQRSGQGKDLDPPAVPASSFTRDVGGDQGLADDLQSSINALQKDMRSHQQSLKEKNMELHTVKNQIAKKEAEAESEKRNTDEDGRKRNMLRDNQTQQNDRIGSLVQQIAMLQEELANERANLALSERDALVQQLADQETATTRNCFKQDLDNFYAIKHALEEEKASVARMCTNCESELKSLQAIQSMALQDDGM